MQAACVTIGRTTPMEYGPRVLDVCSCDEEDSIRAARPLYFSRYDLFSATCSQVSVINFSLTDITIALTLQAVGRSCQDQFKYQIFKAQYTSYEQIECSILSSKNGHYIYIYSCEIFLNL